MKKMKWLTVLLAVVCVITLTACGTDIDPTAYAEGTLEAHFHGNISEEYASALGISEEKLEKQFDEAMNTYAAERIAAMGISDPTEEMVAETRDMLVNAYTNTKFDVAREYTEGENGEYYVEVTAYSLVSFYDIISDKDGSLTAALADAYTADRTYGDIVILSLEMTVDAVNEALKNPVYGDPITFDLKISVGSDGERIISEEQLLELDRILLGSGS